MRERLVTLLCSFGALVLFFTMFMHGQAEKGSRPSVPRPTTEVKRGNGYYAAMQWLEREQFRAVSLRERFDKLPELPGLPAKGNVLIVTLPATTMFKTEELRPLDRWVRAGNTLLVLAALSDNPDWAFALTGMTPGDLNLLTGLEFETIARREHRVPISRITAVPREFTEPHRAVLVPNRPHAYLAGVREAVALSDYPSQAWTVKVPYEGFVFSLARDRESGQSVLWTRPLGDGRIVVSGLGSLFTNRAIGLADNGRLFANILGADLGPGGVVLFDDAHQGLSAAYDPAKFYRDPRLYQTLGVLALLWLSWVLGSTRLRAPVTRAAVPREVELVRATGGFLARVLKSSAAARRMFEYFLHNRAPETGGEPFRLSSSEAAWEVLERHPRIAPADLRQLKIWYADARGSRRVPLTRLHNLIVKVDRQMNPPPQGELLRP